MTHLQFLEKLIRHKHPSWNIHVTDRGLWLYDDKGRNVCDVVSFPGTYGGDEGLLEWWDGKRKTDPQGWLTAEEALALFETALKEKEKPLEYKDFLRENMKTMMDSAKIPEGLQRKILEKEGLKAPQNTSEES